MVKALFEALSGLPAEATTFILAMLPISELRGAIPYGLSTGMGLRRVLALSIAGNLLPVIPLLAGLEPVSEYLRRFFILRKFFDWLFARTRRRAGIIEKYEALGLILFVAIPLPITGAWTGCVAASLFKIRLRYAFFAILIGVIIAAGIVTGLCVIGKGLLYHVIMPDY